MRRTVADPRSSSKITVPCDVPDPERSSVRFTPSSSYYLVSGGNYGAPLLVSHHGKNRLRRLLLSSLDREMEAEAAELDPLRLLNGGSLILLVVAVTGVLNLHRWSARLRVSACEKEPAIVRPFITCSGCPRQGWGRRASRTLPVFTTLC